MIAFFQRLFLKFYGEQWKGSKFEDTSIFLDARLGLAVLSFSYSAAALAALARGLETSAVIIGICLCVSIISFFIIRQGRFQKTAPIAAFIITSALTVLLCRVSASAALPLSMLAVLPASLFITFSMLPALSASLLIWLVIFLSGTFLDAMVKPGIFFNILYFTLVLLACTSSILYQRLRNRFNDVNSFFKEINAKLDKANSEMLRAKKNVDVIFDNVQEGLFLLDKEGVFRGQHSKFLLKILERKDVQGLLFTDLLQGQLKADELEGLATYFTLFSKKEVNPDLLPGLNPLEKAEIKFKREDGEITVKHLEFTFAPVASRKESYGIFGSVKDVTERIELEEQLAHEEERNQVRMDHILQVVNVPPVLLGEFLEDSKSDLTEIDRLLKAKLEPLELLNSVFGKVHALKGNARIVGLKRLASQFSQVEDEIVRLRSGEKKWENMLELIGWMEKMNVYFNDLTGTIESLTKIRQTSSETNMEGGMLGTSLRAITSASAEDTGKTAEISFEGFNPDLIPAVRRKLIKDILVQLVRNSVAHGIESEETRLSSGKDRSGKIQVKNQMNQSVLEIVLSDDGAGINVERVLSKALALDNPPAFDKENPTAAQILEILCHPSFSTSESADETSGRGIGMNLVKKLLEENGGTLSLSWSAGKGTEFKISLPL